MDELENNRVRAVLTQSRPNIPPELQQRLNPTVVDRARLPSGNIPDEIKQRFISNNVAQQSEALNRANATTADATKSPSRIGNFFNKLNDPLVTREGAANAAQKTVNTAKSVGNAVIESPKTATLLKGAARAGGAIQAFNAGNELINGNGNALEKADSAINLGLGVGTTANPIVGFPNLAYQGAKAGGGLITDFANKMGLLKNVIPQPQQQTEGFAALEKKFLESKVAPKVTNAPAAKTGEPTTPNEKQFGFENLSAKEQAAIVSDAQKSGATSANLQLQGANGKINNSVLAVPKAPNAKRGNRIDAAYKPPKQTSQPKPVQNSGIENTPQAAIENPLLALSDEELANTPKRDLASQLNAQIDSPLADRAIKGFDGKTTMVPSYNEETGKMNLKGETFTYPNGKTIVLPRGVQPNETNVPGYATLQKAEQYQEYLNSQLPKNKPGFTQNGVQVNNPVSVINGLTDLIEGTDNNGNPILDYPSRQIVERDAKGNAVYDSQGNPKQIQQFLQTPQLTDNEKTQTIRNVGDIETANIQAQGRITEQGISSGANNAATNQKAGLISEYFNPNTSAQRKAELAPYVVGGEKASKGFTTFKEVDATGAEKTYRMNENTGEISEAKPSTATAKKPNLKEYVIKNKAANPNYTEAQITEMYNKKYGN